MLYQLFLLQQNGQNQQLKEGVAGLASQWQELGAAGHAASAVKQRK